MDKCIQYLVECRGGSLKVVVHPKQLTVLALSSMDDLSMPRHSVDSAISLLFEVGVANAKKQQQLIVGALSC